MTPRELYGKGGLYKGMYTTLDTVKGMAERKGVYYGALENAIKSQEPLKVYEQKAYKYVVGGSWWT